MFTLVDLVYSLAGIGRSNKLLLYGCHKALFSKLYRNNSKVVHRMRGILLSLRCRCLLRTVLGSFSVKGASKSFKSSEGARIELNCLAFQIRRIERIELIRKVRIGIKLTN
jgi:hypothetical protein